MKPLLITLSFFFSFFLCGQERSDKELIEATLNNYIDGFYQGDTTKLKAALKPRLYKFGYLKDKETGKYKYYQHLSYDNALKLAQSIKDNGRTRTESKMRSVKVLEISNHIASAKVTAAWGIDYVLLSKDNDKWMIEEVIWEGPYQDKYQEEQKVTTYYLIRHAEKDKSDKQNRNPHLTDIGQKRAENWLNVFEDVEFDMIYSTNYHRTIETALPTAKANDLEIIYYDPRNMDIDTFMEKTKGKTVLIVGHSNTTPTLANKIIEEDKYSQIDETNNSNLYIINKNDSSITSTLLKIN
ncbi:MAG: nuclear transport factor 2 family protein [Winogradskyella sp.]|uniref:histidine phosphatase family protein n=1 Tax=Winogradskyella sp. TaxID=1883156 RepID=UPI0025E60CB1|nr:nuclear transport factor 2 family protein [Winogradskyella sp.]NRB59197.1 nuclear transport factor 2 family protein [Winogradskyella sp.]